MQVPFLNPGAQTTALREQLIQALTEVLDRGHFILGPQVAALEQEIAAFVGAGHGIGMNSGSDALTLALRAVDVGPGDEVITTPFTYIAPAESVIQVGARLVFADIDPRTFTLDLDDVARRCTPRTKAIIPVHLFGQAANLDALLPLARERGIRIVEDCAQAIGASWQGQGLGSVGDIGCFSFYPTKNLGADGDAGMCVTSDAALAKKLRMLRVHGIERRYFHDLHGYNSRLDEMQAAILRVKLPHLKRWTERRGEIAARYSAGLAGVPVDLPVTSAGNTHCWHVYALRSERRDALQAHLAASGVPTLIYYPQPLHLQKCYADVGWKPGDFPVAEAVSRTILPLPMYPELEDAQVDHVIQSVRGFFGGSRGGQLSSGHGAPGNAGGASRLHSSP
jgi:dTDP-4-amino-4,6-dideoxygalactose transaminase